MSRLLVLTFLFFLSSFFVLAGNESFSTIAAAQEESADAEPASPAPQQEETVEAIDAEFLHDAARKSDVAAVKKAIEAGVDVNAKTEYGSTALFFACDRGNREIVQMLLDAGADPNATDSFYNATPLTWAQSKGHKEVIGLLLKYGVKGADAMLLGAVLSGDAELAAAIIDSEVATPAALGLAKKRAEEKDSDELTALFKDVDLSGFEPYVPPLELLEKYPGKFTSDVFNAEVSLDDDDLMFALGGGGASILEPYTEHSFLMGASSVEFVMNEAGDQVTEVVLTMGGRAMILKPTEEKEETADDAEMSEEETGSDETGTDEPDAGESIAEEDSDDKTEPAENDAVVAGTSDADVSSANWPGFRGTGSRGVADGQNPPLKWDATKDENVRWRRPLPGLGNSCPTVWGNHIYITTATSPDADMDVRIGQYGDVASVEDDSIYEFIIYCVDKTTGEIVWQQTANKAKPMVKRHSKSSHANPTCAADGEHVVAFFGSEGLYCYDAAGNLLWEKNLGFLDSGWFYDSGYQWGFGASPVIFEDRVIVQCDIQKDSFVAAFDLKTGNEIWRTPRKEIPTWSSPVVHRFGDLPMLLTHGTRAARGYDARDGSLLWSLAEHSEIVVPTPIVAHDLIFVTSGYTPVQPVIAIEPDARGEIQIAGRTMEDGTETTETGEGIAWSVMQGGPYMPTPIAYGDYLYTCANNGVLTCYEAETGEEIYKERMKASGGSLSFTGSPVAADGYLYMTTEDGRTLVVKAGEEYELVEVNKSGGIVMSTPSISEGSIFIRTQTELLALGDAEEAEK